MSAVNDINRLPTTTPQSKYESSVRIEITTHVLARLLAHGQLCAAEFHCLDCISKKQVQNLCLQTCLTCMQTRTSP